MSGGWGPAKLCRGCGWYFRLAEGTDYPETCGDCLEVIAFEQRLGMKPALERLRDAEGEA